MKKAIQSILCLSIALLSCVLLFTACGDDDTETHDPKPKPNKTNPTTSSIAGDHTHSFGEWVIVKDYTCTEDGLQERFCDCGEREEQISPALGHIPGEWVIYEEATATESGSRRVYCLVCDNLLQEEVIPATGTQGLDYRVNEDGVTCTVTGIGSCHDSKLVIGSTIDGYTVTAIGAWAFENCTNLYSVVIPDTVTSWTGQGAFSGCTGLASVTLSKNLTAIESLTFDGCTRLNNVIIPDSVTSIGSDAFRNCTKLYDFTMSNNVTYIGSSAFKNTGYYNTASNWGNDVLYVGDHLVEAKKTISGTCVVKEGTRTICAYAFSDCTGLTGITFPNSLIAIYDCAFMRCSGLTSIIIPDSVSEIRSGAFNYCSALCNITLPDNPIIMGMSPFSGTAYYDDAANWDNNVLYVGNHLIRAGESFSGDYAIRPGTRTISDYAFSGKTNLTGIVIPESVGYIGASAFDGCSKLTELVIPDSVTLIGSRAFALCGGLTNIVVPLGVTELAYEVFFRCYDLTSVTIPHSVTSISRVFGDCYKLKDIYYTGTMAQWEAVAKDEDWNEDIKNCVIHCTDGDIIQ